FGAEILTMAARSSPETAASLLSGWQITLSEVCPETIRREIVKSSKHISAARNRRVGEISFLILALFLIASCLTLAVVEASVSGELDPTFAGGRAVTDFFGGNEAASGTPSIVGASVDQLALWPPNHRMVDVTVSYDIIDNCSGNAGVTASLSVTSNEAVTGT